MTSSSTYLYFKGDCDAALKRYADILGAKIEFVMRAKDSPMAAEWPAGMLDGVMHATFSIGAATFMASDVPPAHYDAPKGFHINIGVDEPAEAERIYAALSENGVATMQLAETFWAKRFGTCVDRFGTPWMVNCAKPMG